MNVMEIFESMEYGPAPEASAPALAWIEERQPFKLFINNRWVEPASGHYIESINPATSKPLARVAAANNADVDAAVSAARAAFETWSKTPGHVRARYLYAIARHIQKHARLLAVLESLDNGKPIRETRDIDIPLVARHFYYHAGWAQLMASELPGYEAVGVVGQIIPWNFPLLMAAWKLGPVLAAGCTVVLKPAEQTPLSALRLGELMQEAGLPDGVVNIVTGFGDAGAALAAHDEVDKVAFTGSTEVGKLIVKAAAGNLKKVTLELGGKSPNVVYADADMETAISGAANAIFFNHGQCCNAGSRLYVQRDAYDDVVAGVAEAARSIKVGPGQEADSEMGPLISDEQFGKVLGYLRSGQEDGAEAVVGGDRAGERGYFVQPTILANTNRDMKVEREEIFGPVVCAIPFDSPEEIVTTANNSNYGLAAGVFTSDLSKAHRTAARLRAGTVWINTYHVFDAALPFGGYKESGWGREMGHNVLDNYLETKSVCVAL